MDVAEVRAKVKEIIANATRRAPTEIGDRASLTADLHLDSLSLLEIGVDVDHTFQLGFPEEQLWKLRTVEDTVQLVMEWQHQGAKAVTV